ncbi:MAG: NAD(P)/FAD-dependent oxidoreductase [Acidimicrobiales bacterium]
MAPAVEHHHVVIVGGGTAGITVAARLRRKGTVDVAVIEPSETHWYQPLWTLVGGGCATIDETHRPESRVMPRGVTWIRGAAGSIDPEERTVTLDDGRAVSYGYLVVCPGIQLNWDKVPGLADALGTNGVSSNYLPALAPKTWELVRSMRSGTAVFTMPAGPIKCAGAPQKIAYLAADYWQRQGVADDIHVVLVLPTPTMFGVPEFSKVLEGVAARYDIEVRFSHELAEVHPDAREVVLVDRSGPDGRTETLSYDLLHAVPPQSAPDWIAAGPLADPASPFGYVEVDKSTHQHVRYPNVFSLGDAGSTPNSKTGAAIRKQAPVVVANLTAAMASRPLPGIYDGYASCPLTTARNRMLLAEFDYTMRPRPTIPIIDTQKERYDMWLLKRWGLPFMYWNFMLKGLA